MQQVTVVGELLLQGKGHLPAIKLAVQAGLLLTGGIWAEQESQETVQAPSLELNSLSSLVWPPAGPALSLQVD